MAIVIEPYGTEHENAVRAFNRRLRDGGELDFEFPQAAVPHWLPPLPGRRIYQEYFVARDEAGVHGGYIIKRQGFAVRGADVDVGYYHLPLSEGIVNKTYSLLGSQLLLDALRRQPVMYALGMGGFDRPLPRMLQGIGWKMTAVPFLFKVVHGGRFLRHIRPLRGSVARRIALDALAFSGLGSLAIRAMQRTRAHPVRFEQVSDFGDWTTDLWQRTRHEYAMVAARDADTLTALYPASSDRFTRVRVGEKGWAVLLDTQMRDHKYFGDLRVGTIADCFAGPADAADVARAATAALEARGVDLIVSNQSHAAWIDALRAAGFREGPSNFIFAASRKLSAILDPFDQTMPGIHMTRGDGDGPIHL
jgi:hypothetical protein